MNVKPVRGQEVSRTAPRDHAIADMIRAVVTLIGADRRQARVRMRYVVALLDSAAPLRALVENRVRDAIDLTNGNK